MNLSETYSLLLVDDNPMNLDMLSRRLANKGFLVQTANGGAVALDYLKEETFDLVLLDLMMPDMDGLEVLTELRKNFSMAHLPVIMLTADTERENLIRAFELGANDYLSKPVDFDIMLARIRSQVQHRHLERSLRESEDQFRELFESTSDLIFGFSPEGQLLYFNQAVLQVLGFSEEQFKHKSLFELIQPNHLLRFEAVLESLHSKKQLSQVQLNLQSASGLEIMLEGNLSTRYRQGKLASYQGIFHNISERKKAEGMQNAFISMVSHELRTPMTAIRGSMSLALKGVVGPLTPKLEQLLDIAARNCERLIFLINDILDIEKIRAGMMEYDFKPLNLSELVRSTVEANQSYAQQYQISYQILPCHEADLVTGDRLRLGQVLTNLLSNAAKFSHAHGEVDISIEALQQGSYRVKVQDYGEGIPLEFQQTIFNRFSQADSSSTRSKGGTGLGLAISKEIVEAHGAHLVFESVPGQGTCFYFDLPAIEGTRDE